VDGLDQLVPWPCAERAGALLHVGFRQFSHHGSEIQIALANGDLARPPGTDGVEAVQRSDLHGRRPVTGRGRAESIEHGLLLSQRHVFGVFFWFIVRPADGCGVLPMAEHSARAWSRAPSAPTPPDRFGEFARRAFAWIDWAPARLTALGYAIVGDFEARFTAGDRCQRARRKPLFRRRTRARWCWRRQRCIGPAAHDGHRAARYFDEVGNEGPDWRSRGPPLCVRWSDWCGGRCCCGSRSCCC